MSAQPEVERRLVRWLTHTPLPLAVALLAVALALPALEGGWLWDDIFHHAVLLGRTDFSPWEMFSFGRGGPDPVRSSIDSGVAPWWTSQNFRFTLLRFLTVATHRLDHALWPNSPALMHAHSLVWFGLLVAAAASLYRRVLGAGWVAGLAALAYSVDEVHVWPAAWIANRHSLLATFFGLLCLIAHDRYRRDSWRQGAWLAPLSLALALAAGESATATLGYLAGHAFFLDRAPRRLAALAPYGVIVALWASVYRVFGFGIAGSGIYIDPGAEPARFAAALIRRAPFSVLGQLTAIPADVGGVLAPGFPPGLWMFALAAVIVLLLLILPLLRGDNVARFFAAGMLLSTVPISGTLPASRHLVFVGFGAMGLVAQLVQGAFAGAPWMPVSRAWRYTIRAYAALLLLWHPALSWTSFPIQISSMKALAEPTTTALESLPTDAALVHQDLIVVNTSDYFFFVSLAPALDQLTSRPAPRHIRALANGLSPVAITRRDAQSLEVRLERGLFMSTLARFFRADADPLAPGQIISLTGLTITIEETAEDGSPTRILYGFDRPLEDSTLRWVYWLYGVYLPFTLPGIGMTVHLEPAVGPIEQLAVSALADATAQRSR